VDNTNELHERSSSEVLLTPGQAGRRLKLSRYTVQHLCRSGVLPATRTGESWEKGRVWLIRAADLHLAADRPRVGRPRVVAGR
jgi:excisionase family DNA binding protein